MNRLLLLTASFLVAAATATYAQSPRVAELVKPLLLADTTAVQPGKPFRVGLLVRIRPSWHIYWRNPGDAGQAPTLAFDLPGGFKASDTQFPVPTKFLQPGDLLAYGYADEVMLVTRITPPPSLSSSSLPLHVNFKYLVCDDKQCLPGKQDLSLTLPINIDAAPANESAFEEWTRALPVAGPDAAKVADLKVTSRSNHYTVDVAWKTPADNVEFFPGASGTLTVHDVTVKNKPSHSTITFDADLLANQKPDVDNLDCLVVYTDDRGVRRGIEAPVPVKSGK